MPPPFLDTNVLLRHLLHDHPDHSPRATSLIVRIERGEAQVQVSDTVIFETVFTLEHHYRQPRDAIGRAILELMRLPGFVLPGKLRFERTFDYYVKLNISFADAYHAVLSEGLGSSRIISFDRNLDRVRSLVRVEP